MSPSALAAPAAAGAPTQARSRTLSFRRRRTKSAAAASSSSSTSASGTGAPEAPPPLPTQPSDKSFAELSMVAAAQPTPAQRRDVAVQPPPFPDRPLYMACYCEENAWLLVQHLANVCSNRNAEAKAKAALANRADAGAGAGTELPKEVWDAYVIVVSNSDRSVVMWSQRASSDPSGIVCWDYHVFVVLSVKQTIAEPQPASSSSSSPPPLDASSHKRRASLFRRSTSSLRPSAAEVAPPLPTSRPGTPSASPTAWVYDADSLLCGFDPKSATPAALAPCALDAYIHGSFQPDADVEVRYRPTFRVVPAALYLKYFSSDRSHMRLASAAPDAEVAWAATPPAWAPLAGEGARSEGDLNNLFERYVDLNDARDARYGSVLGAAAFHSAAWLRGGLGMQPGRSLLDLPPPVDVWRAPPSRAQAVISEVLARQPDEAESTSDSIPSTPPLAPNWQTRHFATPPARLASPSAGADDADTTPRRRGGRIASPLFPAYAAAALASRAGRARGSYMGFEAAELSALARAINGDEAQPNGGARGVRPPPPPPPPPQQQLQQAAERPEVIQEEQEPTAL